MIAIWRRPAALLHFYRFLAGAPGQLPGSCAKAGEYGMKNKTAKRSVRKLCMGLPSLSVVLRGFPLAADETCRQDVAFQYRPRAYGRQATAAYSGQGADTVMQSGEIPQFPIYPTHPAVSSLPSSVAQLWVVSLHQQ